MTAKHARILVTTSNNPMHTKQEAKFTPGEWKAYNSNLGRIYKSWRVCGPDNEPIAVISETSTPEQEYANAKLIASAPTMRALLVRVLDFQPRLTACDSDGGSKLVSEIYAILSATT